MRKRRRRTGGGEENVISLRLQWPLGSHPCLKCLRLPLSLLIRPQRCTSGLMQSAAELLKKHMLLLHCGLPAVSPSAHSWGNIANTHTHTRWALSLELSLGNSWSANAAVTSRSTRQAQKIQRNKRQEQRCRPWSLPSCGTLEFLALSLSSDVSLLTALPLFVLRRTLNARFNLLKERLLTEERSKFLTAENTGEKREALYRLPHTQHARTCLNLPPHSQSNVSSWFSGWDLCWCVEKMKYLYMIQEVQFE